MSKGNQKAYNGGISPKTVGITAGGEPLTHQEIDNLNLNAVNRVGIPGNKQQSGQSRQDYDNQLRGVK